MVQGRGEIFDGEPAAILQADGLERRDRDHGRRDRGAQHRPVLAAARDVSPENGGAGERGIAFNQGSGRLRILDPGFKPVIPLVEKVTRMDVRIRKSDTRAQS